MNLKEANKKKQQLENDLKYYTRERESNLKRVGISATIYDKINTTGGKRDDKFASYMEYLEENDKHTIIELEEKIKDTINRIKNIEEWIENELKILSKFGEVEQQVIYLREVDGLKWDEIAWKTKYSSRQCQRIHYKYKKGKRK